MVEQSGEFKGPVKLSQFSEEAIKAFPFPAPAIDRVIAEGAMEPNGKPFMDLYKPLSDYRRKFAVAMAFIKDGRYVQPQEFLSNFAAPNVDLTPDEQNLARDLKTTLIDRGFLKPSKEEFKQFTEEVAEGKTLQSQEFRQLLGLFGASTIVDILFMFRPEFRGIPVEEVSSTLGDYMGNYLVVKGQFNPDDIEKGVDYLPNKRLREALVENAKNSCLEFYNRQKKAGNQGSDQEIVAQYLETLDAVNLRLNNADLNIAITQVKDYYTRLFNDMQKPANLVDALKEGRDFPDLNQRINIQEVKDKQRILIADEMGLGKSASAIFAKEYLGVKLALIVAPSNVVSTWTDYLSSKQDAEGNQVGYFKSGSEPRVLVVQDLKTLENFDASQYDYVVISQERLTTEYTTALKKIDFGMMIVDEMHKLKNLKEGVRANNLLELAQGVNGEGKYMVALSGTPVPNKIQDLAITLKLLYPEQFMDVDNRTLVSQIIHGEIVGLRYLLSSRMQMKELRESINMPELHENIIWINLSDEERDAYEILMEEDEINHGQKLAMMREFPLNPDLLDPTPGIEGSKVKELSSLLKHVFETKDKVVVFVNDYVEDVIRGENAILSKLGLPADIGIRVIEGDVKEDKRRQIQQELKGHQGKIVVFINGMTADVGVDFSGGEAVIFYNEPWTEYKRKQQLSRVYRPPIDHEVDSYIMIAGGTLEEGIHYHIEAKYKAVQKLLKGVPITELEKQLLESDEDISEEDLEVNPELAAYYFASWHRLLKMFGYAKGLGEEKFSQFLERYGQSYAEYYTDLGSRSYQANASRVCGTTIDELCRLSYQNPSQVKILDVASGPEMLKKHMIEGYQGSIYSFDINRHHFNGTSGNHTYVGGFGNLPFRTDYFDYVNLSLALQDASFVPSEGKLERLQVLMELARVLKIGGRATINLIYSSDIKDFAAFNALANNLGLRIIPQYTGEVTSGQNYRSHLITLDKLTECNPLTDEDLLSGEVSKNITATSAKIVAECIDKEQLEGLKLPENKSRIKDSRRTISTFTINGITHAVRLNHADQIIAAEEAEIISEGEALKDQFGGVDKISKDEIINRGFLRVRLGQKYALFKRLISAPGAVVIK